MLTRSLLHMLAMMPQSDDGGAAEAAASAPLPPDPPIAGTGEGIWMPPEASTVAPTIDMVFDVITWICIFFFVGIMVMMFYFVWKYRRPAADHPPHTDAPTHNTPMEVTWTIIPLLLVIVIFYVGMKGYMDLRVVPADAYEVNVTGQKWMWQFDHPESGASETAILRVPANKPVKLTMVSTDVLHAMYIPAFRVKQDVVPGRYAYLWFEATEPGTYDLYCAEYCGTKHSQMLGKVLVYEEEEFGPAIAAAAEIFRDVPTEQHYTVVGKKLFPRCAACHSLDGSDGVAPSFRQTHEMWGQERRFADGSSRVIDENYVRESILNPQAQIIEGRTGAMPSFQGALDEEKVQAIVQFIKRLDEFDEQGNWIGGGEDSGEGGENG